MPSAYQATPGNTAVLAHLAVKWETTAENLADATGVPRHPNVLDVLRACATELRRALGAQASGTEPAPDIDPLGHVRTGDLSPAQPGLCDGTTRTPDGKLWMCTRAPHPPRWQHVASGIGRVRAVWTDDATVTDR